MKRIRWASFVLLLGAVTSNAATSQPFPYGPPPGAPGSTDARGHDGDAGYGDRYDDQRYDDQRYDDQRYDDQGYDDQGYDAAPTAQVDVGFFFNELSPYGDWVRTRTYGWAWFPRNVRASWRPYTDGRWVSTEYGWTWASNEPFGWATYHYGRWAWDGRIGWIWVPGRDWGPAWVSWQTGGGYIGWAPLPPSVGFEVGIGIRLGGFNLSVGIRPDAYSFVQERAFLDTRLAGHLLPSARNVTIIHNTTNVTNYTYVDNRVVNRGIEVRRIEQVTGRRVRALRVAETRSRARTEVDAREMTIYRPDRRQLETVRVHVERRPEAPTSRPGANRPPMEPRRAPDVEVAPRPRQVPRTDTRQLEQQERRAQQELQQYQAHEKRRLDELQKQETAKARAQAERTRIEKQHQAEREALQAEQREAAQQLTERQKARRRAEQAEPPNREANPRGDRTAEPPEKKDKDKDKDKDRGRERGERPVRPPKGSM